MKTLYFDTETTGLLDPEAQCGIIPRYEVVQLAYILDIDDNVVAEGNIFMRPEGPIDPEALAVQGRTEDQVRSFPPAREGLAQFNYALSKHIDQFDKQDKANPAAANGSFDLGFLQRLYVSQGDKYFGSWQNWQLIDPISMARQAVWAGTMSAPNNFKLGTLCQHFGVELTAAHDALADTRAMRTLTMLLRDRLYNIQRGRNPL